MSEVDMKKLEVAIKYAERMAEGNNPVKNEPAESDSVLNNPNVIRCMYFIKEVLQQVKYNGGVIGGKTYRTSKRPFPFEVLSNFQYQQDKSISHFLAQVKDLAGDSDVRGIGTKPITDWLKQMGYLAEEYDQVFNQKKAITTPEGEAFGLYMETRTSANGNPYDVVMYSKQAQEYIVHYMETILNADKH